MKKTLIFLLSLTLIFTLSLPCFANDENLLRGENIIDEAELLTEKERETVSQYIDTVEKTYGIDIVIATADYLWNGITMESFARSAFEACKTGRDGAVLVICMDYEGYREYRFQGFGKVYDVFTDDVVSHMEDVCLSHLSEENFGEAFRAFAGTTGEMIALYDAGTPYELPIPWVFLAVVSLAAGFLIAGIVVLILWAQLKSVSPQSAARQYVKQGSLNITDRKDLYLYSTVSRVAKPKNNSSGGGGGGSHSRGGGGGGRF